MKCTYYTDIIVYENSVLRLISHNKICFFIDFYRGGFSLSVFVGPTESFYGYTATTLAEYIRRISYIKINKHIFFRGMSNISYDLIPSLCRCKIDEDICNLIEQESRLVEYSEQRFPESFSKPLPTMLIANMQHFGIPTRMLDVTSNALVALYFACKNEDKDGVVYVFGGFSLSAYNPYANIIADTYRLTNNCIISVDTYLDLISKQIYSSHMFYPKWEDDTMFVNSLKDQLSKPLIIDVGNINQRQINQSGKFILFPNIIKNGYIQKELVKMTKDNEELHTKILIPKNSKNKILEQLKLVGINEDFLFPDNTSQICKGIIKQINYEKDILT